MPAKLYYIHDPMCSWCWGFSPALKSLLQSLPSNIAVERILGGLAPDSDEPMAPAMQHMLQQTWLQIQSTIPGTQFNFDFWTDNQPRRSTWPSCRAVLAARSQDPAHEIPMISAIQQAYYLDALNTSDTQTLVSLAVGIGCDPVQFSADIHSEETRKQLLDDIHFSRSLGVHGFPSLVFQSTDGSLNQIMVDYNRPAAMLERIEQLNHG